MIIGILITALIVTGIYNSPFPIGLGFFIALIVLAKKLDKIKEEGTAGTGPVNLLKSIKDRLTILEKRVGETGSKPESEDKDLKAAVSDLNRRLTHLEERLSYGPPVTPQEAPHEEAQLFDVDEPAKEMPVSGVIPDEDITEESAVLLPPTALEPIAETGTEGSSEDQAVTAKVEEIHPLEITAPHEHTSVMSVITEGKLTFDIPATEEATKEGVTEVAKEEITGDAVAGDSESADPGTTAEAVTPAETEKSDEPETIETAEASAEEPVDEQVETSAEESGPDEEQADELTEESTEEPIDELPVEPAEETVEDPVEEQVEVPEEELVEEPVEVPVEEPVHIPARAPMRKEKKRNETWDWLQQKFAENWTGVLGSIILVMGVGFLSVYGAFKVSPFWRFTMIVGLAVVLFGAFAFLKAKTKLLRFALWLRSTAGAIFLFACVG
ncbi:MAG: hypothetical protein GY757_51000, partial [bacterium]|nr:hypothetical protein [bacterium]